MGDIFMKILNRNIEMTTSEYAEYRTNLLGERVSPESVYNMCKKGKLDAYQLEENGRWIIKVQINFVPYDEYKQVVDELSKYKMKLENISKLCDISGEEQEEDNQTVIYNLKF